MQTLRQAMYLSRFVLVWFALSLCVAIASPFVNAKGMDLVCTSTGSMKLVVQGSASKVDGNDAQGAPSSHTLDCPLCASLSGPPPAALGPASTLSVGVLDVRLPKAAAHIAVQTAPPMPSRGPPLTLL